MKFLRPGEAAEAIFPARRFDERSRNILAVSSLTLSAVIVAGLILFRSHYLLVGAVLCALMAGDVALIRWLAPWRIVVVTP